MVLNGDSFDVGGLTQQVRQKSTQTQQHVAVTIFRILPQLPCERAHEWAALDRSSPGSARGVFSRARCRPQALTAIVFVVTGHQRTFLAYCNRSDFALGLDPGAFQHVDKTQRCRTKTRARVILSRLC